MIGSSVQWKGRWNGLLGKWADSTDYPLNPNGAPGLQARYNIADLSSLIYDGSNRVQLVGDVSGNSNVNVLCLNGANGNYASTPDSAALSITGDIDIRVWVAMNDWTPAANTMLLSKWEGTASSNRSYALRVVAATGVLSFVVSVDGSASVTATSTAAPTITDLSALWIRVTRASASGDVIFYTSQDGSAWTQLGATVSTAASAIFDSNTVLLLGGINPSAMGELLSGRIYRAQIYNGINGTLVFDADFSLAAKLASSFVCSTGQTVTINTTGDLGARISGARDLVQMTVAKQPVLTVSATGNFLTFDGSNDYLKAASFALVQPETVYFVGKQVTWGASEWIYDGNVANVMSVYEVTSTPRIQQHAGTGGNANDGWATNTLAVITGVYNGASSGLRVNRGTASSATNIGAGAANGFTIADRGDAGGFISNITFSEAIIYSTAQNTPIQNALITGLMARWGISS